MQAGACGIHPARENPLHLALQRDLVDLDKGVGVGGFGGRPRVAGVGLHAQRAELHGLADILVEIDDAAGDLVEAREARLLVGDLGGRRLGHDLVARLQGCRRLRHALGLTLARRQRIAWRRRVGDARLAGLRRLRPRCPAGYSAERRWCRAAAPAAATARFRARGTPCPGGGRFGVGSRRPRGSSGTSSSSSGSCCCALLIAARDGARRPQRRIGKDIADLRARGRRKRDCRGGHQGRKTGQGNGSKHLAALKGESGSRHSTDLSAARVPTG